MCDKSSDILRTKRFIFSRQGSNEINKMKDKEIIEDQCGFEYPRTTKDRWSIQWLKVLLKNDFTVKRSTVMYSR